MNTGDEDEFIKQASDALLDSVGPDVVIHVPAHVPRHGWCTVYKDGAGEHVVPASDTYAHYAFNCACQPMLLDDTFVHNAWDRRDDYAERRRKPS